MNKAAAGTKILVLRTMYRYKLGRLFWFCPILRWDTNKGKWHSLYLQTRYRTKFGWIFRFTTIHVRIRRNLGNEKRTYAMTSTAVYPSKDSMVHNYCGGSLKFGKLIFV